MLGRVVLSFIAGALLSAVSLLLLRAVRDAERHFLASALLRSIDMFGQDFEGKQIVIRCEMDSDNGAICFRGFYCNYTDSEIGINIVFANGNEGAIFSGFIENMEYNHGNYSVASQQSMGMCKNDK